MTVVLLDHNYYFTNDLKKGKRNVGENDHYTRYGKDGSATINPSPLSGCLFDPLMNRTKNDPLTDSSHLSFKKKSNLTSGNYG